MTLIPLNSSYFDEMRELWWRSVLATHSFIAQEDLDAIKLQIKIYFSYVELQGADEDGNLLGFIGIAEDEIQMLFLDPKSTRKGMGKALCEWAFEKGAYKVAVNEENLNARGFYEHLGFQVVSRSDLDDQGRPYPVLKMER